jgi:hypothetical protein
MIKSIFLSNFLLWTCFVIDMKIKFYATLVFYCLAWFCRVVFLPPLKYHHVCATVKHQILAYSMLWCSNGQGLHSTPLKLSNDQLECHGFLYSFSLFARISTTGSLLWLYTVWKLQLRTVIGRMRTYTRAVKQHHKDTHESSAAECHYLSRTGTQITSVCLPNVHEWSTSSWYAWCALEVEMEAYL